MSERCHLHPEQERIISRLLEFLKNPAKPAPGFEPSTFPPRTAAVVGPRGIGKSTVLAALKSDLEHATWSQNPWLIPLPILDAAVVHDDLGLAAATIRELYRTVKGKAVPAAGRDRSHELPEKLDRSFRRCVESALLQEESHRRLAQELAMTPGHYGKIVFDANDRKAGIGSEFSEFLHDLIEMHRALTHPVSTETKPTFVVLVDDLDLGPSRVVLRWVRSLLTDYCDPRVCWVLAFHREPLIRLLSLPPENDERVEAAPANGQALLSKAVPSSRQWELRRWTAQERQEFRPLPSSPGKTDESQPGSLRNLLANAGRGELVTLLPAHPRALEGEYIRLQSGDPLSAEEMLRRIALVSGEAELVRLLDERGGALLGSSLSWQRVETGEAGWQALVEAARNDNPLWGLPLPESFARLVSGPDPEAYLETLLDIALAEGKLTPYQLLQRLPFASARVAGAQSELRIPEPDVLRYFSPEGAVATELVSTALGWQRWSEEADKDRFWTVALGPTGFWELCLDLRTASPESLFRTLSLERIPVAPRPAGAPAFLPNRLRPLILLVDGLSRSAWQALSTARTFWRPLTFTRCVAAFTLAGYVRHRPLGRVEEVPKLLRLTDPKASRELLALTEADVEAELGRLVGWLETQTREASTGTFSSPAALAAAELNTALATFLSLPGVARLVPRSSA
jgi:hypothetical protein